MSASTGTIRNSDYPEMPIHLQNVDELKDGLQCAEALSYAAKTGLLEKVTVIMRNTHFGEIKADRWPLFICKTLPDGEVIDNSISALWKSVNLVIFRHGGARRRYNIREWEVLAIREPYHSLSEALIFAAANGHLEIVQALLTNSRFSEIHIDELKVALECAIENDYLEVIQELIENSRFSELSTYELKQIFEWVIEKSPPQNNIPEILQKLMQNNHFSERVSITHFKSKLEYLKKYCHGEFYAERIEILSKAITKREEQAREEQEICLIL